MRILLTCLLFLGIGLPAEAAAPQSRYTSIANKDCRFDPVGDQPGEAEDQLKTCPGLGGAKVLVNAFHTSVRIGFAWPGKPKMTMVLPVVSAWGAGLKVEWRGIVGAKGAKNAKGFEPYAATVRMKYREEGKPGEQQVLAVMRVTRGEACLVGAVDVRANKDAYELARSLADTAPAFDCAKDAARIVGAETEWAKSVVADADAYGTKRQTKAE